MQIRGGGLDLKKLKRKRERDIIEVEFEYFRYESLLFFRDKETDNFEDCQFFQNKSVHSKNASSI